MPTDRVTDDLPTLVGESNPYGGDPHYALYPAPDVCSGHRLCCLILRMRRPVYLRVFDRVNLCDGPWRLREARLRADTLRASGRLLILCGARVCQAFRLEFRPFSIALDGRTLILPHPSGLNRLWNVSAFLKAREAVALFIPELAPMLGQLRPEDA